MVLRHPWSCRLATSLWPSSFRWYPCSLSCWISQSRALKEWFTLVDRTVEKNLEGSIDPQLKLIRNSNILGFWCYDAFILPKQSRSVWPWHRSNGQGSSRLASNIQLVLLRDFDVRGFWCLWSYSVSDLWTPGVPKSVKWLSSFQTLAKGFQGLGHVGFLEIPEVACSTLSHCLVRVANISPRSVVLMVWREHLPFTKIKFENNERYLLRDQWG